MTDDAKFLLELFERQYVAIKETLTARKRYVDDFDRLSYHAWAIGEAIKIISGCVTYVSVHEIRCILDEMHTMYMEFYNQNVMYQEKFKHAADAIEKLYKLTEGFRC